METAGPFSAVSSPMREDTAGHFSALMHAVSLKQLKAPEERQGRLHDPSLQRQ